MRFKIIVISFFICLFTNYLCALDQQNLTSTLEDMIKRSDSVVVGRIHKYSDTGVWDGGVTIGDDGRMMVDGGCMSGIKGFMEVETEEIIKGSLNKNDKISIFYYTRPGIKYGDRAILFLRGVSSSTMILEGIIYEDNNKAHSWINCKDRDTDISMKDYIEIVKKSVNNKDKNEKK